MAAAASSTTIAYHYWDPPVQIPTSMPGPNPPTKVYTFPNFVALPTATATTQPQARAHKRGGVTEVQVEVEVRSQRPGDEDHPEAVRGEQRRGSNAGVGALVAPIGWGSGAYARTYKSAAAAAGGKVGFAVGGLLVLGSLAWVLL